MCGRYTLITDMDTLQARFSFESVDLGLAPSFNVAPTQQVLTVVNDGENHARYMRWGLILSWFSPAVLGTGKGTSVIQDGQIVEVDGDAGVVRIILS